MVQRLLSQNPDIQKILAFEGAEKMVALGEKLGLMACVTRDIHSHEIAVCTS